MQASRRTSTYIIDISKHGAVQQIAAQTTSSASCYQPSCRYHLSIGRPSSFMYFRLLQNVVQIFEVTPGLLPIRAVPNQTGSNSILSWLTRSPDEPSVQIRICLFLSLSSNSANEPCILLQQGVEHTAHHFRFRISRSSTILCRLSGQCISPSFP